jgi:hypothetical protein
MHKLNHQIKVKLNLKAPTLKLLHQFKHKLLHQFKHKLLHQI